MIKKYELILYSENRYRIRALRNFGDVKKGDLGGLIRSEQNLSQEGDCWIYDNAFADDNSMVCGNAKIYDDVLIGHDSIVCDNARLYRNSSICHDCIVSGDAILTKSIWLSGSSKISGTAILDLNISTGDIIVDHGYWCKILTMPNSCYMISNMLEKIELK